jgi:hypothetical protein
MLKDGVELVVISLIVLGGIFVWWTQAPTHSLSAPAEPQVQESQANTKPSPLVVKASPKPKSAPDPVVEPPAVIETAPIPVPVVQRDQLPFPAVEQIATGGHEDSITGKYGDPALSAVTSSRGHMVETFVYAKDRGRLATVIRLQDGRVSAAYSQSEPTMPVGLSAPRRWHSK